MYDFKIAVVVWLMSYMHISQIFDKQKRECPCLENKEIVVNAVFSFKNFSSKERPAMVIIATYKTPEGHSSPPIKERNHGTLLFA